MESLNKIIKEHEKKLKELTTQNEKDELLFMKEFKKVSQEYDNNMKQYDQDLETQMLDQRKCENDYNDAYKELQQYTEEYKMRMEEKRKRDQIEALMQKKADEQNAQRLRLEKASEYIQAHYRGLLARREMEKLRKKKKGKRGKKK